ncbi:glycoside hydrolase family 16 protein [Hyaloscypha variabilis F]|uniref:Glycoside hydrolase family 16 protein n=1 Tax=Hyaloscypha variabilis (strain UAMH 11265 / GT02V1 / F) TaxID=1149755 RepID=A0A2J6RPR9_HYAVF|nr:glycoside hydrolase family 16 protein [Hyaloscypha variabilis F]
MLALCYGGAQSYRLVHEYDYTNWYESFIFETLPDPTHGFVEYISLAESQALGMTKMIGKQVYMGVDNTYISDGGRKSIWLECKDEFLHGLLIGDFAHVPGSDCGTWPSFWTIRNNPGPYGEIDIYEGFNDIERVYMTLHTGGNCSFDPPVKAESGTSNNNNFDCQLNNPVGCSVEAPIGSYGSSLNDQGGGVFAMEWTSTYIKIYFFPRNGIPADIISGRPDPRFWGSPSADFDSQYGNCNIDANFPPQTIYFDTTFCGANAGGASWTDWTDCSVKTGFSTCEDYVANVPHAFDDAYWLVNSVKVYQ